MQRPSADSARPRAQAWGRERGPRRRGARGQGWPRRTMKTCARARHRATACGHQSRRRAVSARTQRPTLSTASRTSLSGESSAWVRRRVCVQSGAEPDALRRKRRRRARGREGEPALATLDAISTRAATRRLRARASTSALCKNPRSRCSTLCSARAARGTARTPRMTRWWVEASDGSSARNCAKPERDTDDFSDAVLGLMKANIATSACGDE
jgi:hypothetical protein